MKADVEIIIALLRCYLEYLGRRSGEKTKKRLGQAVIGDKSPTRDPIVAAFKSLSKVVTVDEGEFWAEIDPARKQRKKVKRTAFSTCVDTSVKDVLRMLCCRDDYNP